MKHNANIPGLKAIEIKDTQIIQDYLKRYPRENCDYTLTNLIAWGKIYRNHYLIHKERLVIFNLKYQYIFFPIGEELSPDELYELYELFRMRFPKSKFILIPEDYIQRHPQLNNCFVIDSDRDWADYIYETESLVDLRGRKLAKKKNLISQFVRANPQYKVMEITEDRLDVILAFTKKWRRERSAGGSYLDTEFEAIQNTMRYWKELPAEGIIICLDYKIAAYSIFSPQTPDMATVHFEKFDPDKKGSAQLINWETARYLAPHYKWINREQDIGIEGLRQAKLSYVPDRLAPFYSLRPRADKLRATAG